MLKQGKMKRTRRAFTPEEKLSLLQEGRREGFAETCRKHSLSPALLARWKLQYTQKGLEGLRPGYRRMAPEIRALQEENENLKRIIARQVLELEVKTELLKRNSYSTEEKVAVIKSRIDRCSVTDLARWVNLPRSNYYYRPHPGPRGIVPSTHTLFHGCLVPNEDVVLAIRDYLVSDPCRAYGYVTVNDELRKRGYLINKKKTYRLMEENQLLPCKVIRSEGNKESAPAEFRQPAQLIITHSIK